MDDDLVREPQEGEIATAGTVLGKAFQDQPIFRAVVPSRAERLTLCTALFTANLRHARQFGGVWVTGSEQDAVNGVIYWVEKPEPILSDDDLKAFGYGPVFERWGHYLETIGQMEHEAQQALGLLGKQWRYLAGVGVDPEHQGQGYGSRLINRVVAESAAAEVDCALVTDQERNVALYERCGFRTVANGTAMHGQVQYWSMIAKSHASEKDGG